MRRPECDPDDVRMQDVLCDFCGRAWSEALPMVEGHQGSCICGDCLADAYREAVLAERPDGAPERCTLCLEHRDEPAWHAPAAPAIACRRCVRQSAAVLAKDPDFGWRKPDPGDARPAVP